MPVEQAIYIRSDTQKHGYTLSLAGGLALVTAIILYMELAQQARLPLIFLMACAFIMLILGVFKLQEPEYSFMLNNDGLYYQHLRGFLYIDWQNVQRIGIPTIRQGFDHTELSYIGFRLVDKEVLLTKISLRLISHLMLEQRAILHKYLRDECPDCESLSEISLNTAPYTTQQGKQIKGLRAMFAHRMDALCKVSGYHFLLPDSGLDRPADEFVKLLKQIQFEANKNVKKNCE
ncbi:DUF2982 domain-containing protein [Gayadomonas joobiniege]|uniref:DUF2982 domain-containing protein n=1 Tax=Gayadomonas joobiniege TaxID=1234606 RepID=UPI00036588A8|nr:DUF2982 domain-containing protein [Gayadomonas joobiniege]